MRHPSDKKYSTKSAAKVATKTANKDKEAANFSSTVPETSGKTPSSAEIRLWRRYLAEERAEEAIYRSLAMHREGRERDILLCLAQAEKRHQEHWVRMLGNNIGSPLAPRWRTRILGFFARHFGWVFALALMQYSERRSTQTEFSGATDEIVADEKVHEEVVRALATQGREEFAGNFRAAIFGANDGMVSNLALVMGVAGIGVNTSNLVLTGLAGLIAGALSMAAGEYVSVSSQRELLEAAASAPDQSGVIGKLNMDENEIELVFKARGYEAETAKIAAKDAITEIKAGHYDAIALERDVTMEVGTPLGAAASSFVSFAIGALIPLIPFFFGVGGLAGLLISLGVVGLALFVTGGLVGILSGSSPLWRAIRQLVIGLAAAGITYGLGLIAGQMLG